MNRVPETVIVVLALVLFFILYLRTMNDLLNPQTTLEVIINERKDAK